MRTLVEDVGLALSVFPLRAPDTVMAKGARRPLELERQMVADEAGRVGSEDEGAQHFIQGLALVRGPLGLAVAQGNSQRPALPRQRHAQQLGATLVGAKAIGLVVVAGVLLLAQLGEELTDAGEIGRAATPGDDLDAGERVAFGMDDGRRQSAIADLSDCAFQVEGEGELEIGPAAVGAGVVALLRSEEHTSELQS